jgi:Ca-activated chloride channel family protein
MNLRKFLLLVPLSALLLISQDSPVFRAEVKLVRLLVTVKDRAGQLVGTLGKDAFTIFDNGVQQDVAVFERQTALPLNVALCIDTSGSTAKELKYELESATRFLNAFFKEGNPEDVVALYSFNWEVVMRSNFTRRMQRLEDGIKRMKGEAGTSLYDAIYFASRDLERRDGRRVIVVVTDGGDTTSAKKYHDALEAAQRADAVIYSILVMPITSDAGRNIGGENALTTLGQGTGGRVFLPSLGAEVDRAFTDILRDLRTQYLVGYYPKNVPLTKNRFHSLKIQLPNSDLQPQYRNGYYGDAAR